MRACAWVLAALVWVVVSGSGWAQSAPASADGRVVDYWIGDFQLVGKIRNDATAKSEQLVPTNTRVKLWLHEDGVPRISSNSCTAALFPAQGEGAITLKTGGKFVEDLAYAGAAKNCGKNMGDVDVEVWDKLTPTAEGMQISVRIVRNISQPAAGRIEVDGQGLLRAVYKRVPTAEELADAKSAPRETPAESRPQKVAAAETRAAKEATSLAATLDRLITHDSSGWLFNRYDRGSARNVRLLDVPKDKKNGIVYGEYSYNGGMAGWVKVHLVNGDANCLEYWDFPGRCRPVGTASYASQAFVGALTAAITAPRSSGGSGGGKHCTPAMNGHDADGRPISLGEYCN